jgi:thiopurine S-methyltransferase
MVDDLTAERLATVREHMESENRHDFDATLATFEHPRYELIATGDVYDGEHEVRRYFAETRIAFPDQRNELLALHPAGDTVVAELVLSGTHRGRLRGMPPTNRTFRCQPDDGRVRVRAPHRADRLRARVLRRRHDPAPARARERSSHSARPARDRRQPPGHHRARGGARPPIARRAMTAIDHAGWLERWREGRINFHEGRVNALLDRHAGRLGSRPRALVPLCGKAEDLAYLAARGHRVVGVELVEDAVRAFFAEHGLAPAMTPRGPMIAYATEAITLYVGDIFDTSPEVIGPVDAIYDRAALIALPAEVRPRYAEHLRRLAPGALVLQLTLEFSHGEFKGPPFAVYEDELRRLYPGARLELLDEMPDARLPTVLERCFLIALA